MGLNELSTVLWRERELLESLLFKLEEEELVLESGRSRWVGRATREVEGVLDQIRGIELGRAIEADDAAREVGLDEGASLQELAAAAPAPWNDLLRSHHVALTDISSQIEAIAHSNRRVLAESVRDTQDALLRMIQAGAMYNDRSHHHFVVRNLHRAAAGVDMYTNMADAAAWSDTAVER